MKKEEVIVKKTNIEWIRIIFFLAVFVFFLACDYEDRKQQIRGIEISSNERLINQIYFWGKIILLYCGFNICMNVLRNYILSFDNPIIILSILIVIAFLLLLLYAFVFAAFLLEFLKSKVVLVFVGVILCLVFFCGTITSLFLGARVTTDWKVFLPMIVTLIIAYFFSKIIFSFVEKDIKEV